MKKATKENVSLGLSCLAILVSIIVAGSQIKQSRISNDLVYKQHLMGNRPMLKLVEFSYNLIDFQSNLTNDSYSALQYSKNRDSIKTESYAIIKKDYKFVNIGNSNAIFIAMFNVDSNVNDDRELAREFFMKSIQKKTMLKGSNDSIQFALLDRFFQYHIYANDSLNITFMDTLKHISADRLLHGDYKEFISHVLLIYENNVEMYFDSFVMLTFRLNYPLYSKENHNMQPPEVIINMDNGKEFFTPSGPIIDESKVYVKKESKPITKLKRQLVKLHEQSTKKYY